MCTFLLDQTVGLGFVTSAVSLYREACIMGSLRAYADVVCINNVIGLLTDASLSASL
jgi:hypothetical protein